MRRLLPLTLLVALAGPPAAAAQSLGVGAKGGVTFVNIVHQPSADYGIESTAKTGFLGGGFVTFFDNSPLSVQVDGVIAWRKVDFGVSVQDLTSFDLPVVARYRVLTTGAWMIRATGGVTSTMIFKATESVLGDDPFDVKVAFEPFILSALVGGQVEWNRRWLFEGRLLFGLTEVDSQPVEGFTSRLRGFEVTAGYRFW